MEAVRRRYAQGSHQLLNLSQADLACRVSLQAARSIPASYLAAKPSFWIAMITLPPKRPQQPSPRSYVPKLSALSPIVPYACLKPPSRATPPALSPRPHKTARRGSTTSLHRNHHPKHSITPLPPRRIPPNALPQHPKLHRHLLIPLMLVHIPLLLRTTQTKPLIPPKPILHTLLRLLPRPPGREEAVFGRSEAQQLPNAGAELEGSGS